MSLIRQRLLPRTVAANRIPRNHIPLRRYAVTSRSVLHEHAGRIVRRRCRSRIAVTGNHIGFQRIKCTVAVAANDIAAAVQDPHPRTRVAQHSATTSLQTNQVAGNDVTSRLRRCSPNQHARHSIAADQIRRSRMPLFALIHTHQHLTATTVTDVNATTKRPGKRRVTQCQ